MSEHHGQARRIGQPKQAAPPEPGAGLVVVGEWTARRGVRA
ncbi:MAG: hypothetical protein ACRD0K_27965 [Egibacteraceae bacterium]